MGIMYYSMVGTIPKSKVKMHPNPGCGIIITCQMVPLRVIVDVKLLVFS
jgi:hypothetical protein